MFFSLRVVIALSLLLQSTILSLPVSAYAPTEEQSPARQADSEEPPVDEWPADEDWPPLDDAPPAPDPGLPPITVDDGSLPSEGPAIITPTLPYYLDLRLDRFVVAPDETALLTVTVYGLPSSELVGPQFMLQLPHGLMTSAGEQGEVRRTLPPVAPDAPAEPWQEIITLHADLVAAGLEQAAFTLEATLSAPGYQPVTAGVLLGVAPRETVTDSLLGASGAVLHDPARGLTLLVPANAAPPETVFSYEPVFRAAETAPFGALPMTQTATVTETESLSSSIQTEAVMATATPVAPALPDPTPTITVSAETATATDSSTFADGAAVTSTMGMTSSARLIYLPAVSGGAVSTQAASSAPEPTPEPTVAPTPAESELAPLWVDGVDVYQQWEFNAIHAGQPITRFAEAMLLLIDARWLVEAGLNPAELDLWMRETADDEWLIEEVTYDAERQQYVARLTHFSGAAIGDGLSARGEILPTLTLFATDRGTGAATVRYPIGAPTGLGGQSPGLALTYSSSAVDDYLLMGGDDDYENQANWVGYGWNLSGISYIDRSEIGSASSMGYYSIVLNGLRSHINGGRDPNAFIDHDFFTKIEPINPSAGNGNFHGWKVTGADGMVYTFGGPVLNGNWPTSEASRDTPLSLHLRANQTRVYDKWHLSEVRDRLGNRMTYHYDAYRGSIKNWSDCGAGFSDSGDVWYTRAVLPREIRWSYTDSTASSYKMRMRFVYSGETRADYLVSGYDDSCKQPVYTRKKLTDLFVEVKENGASNWLVLRRYGLTALEGNMTGYPCGSQCAPTAERHLLLDKISYYGKGGTGTPLHEYKFTYYAETAIAGSNAAMTTNNVRLRIADNGWNGSVEYSYQARLLSSTECNYSLVCTATNQGNERRYRFAVNRTTARDGRGNKLITDYSYANPKMRGELHDGNIHAREFVGFETVTAQHFATVAEAQSPSVELRYEEARFHQATVSPNPSNNSQAIARDPRSGKQQYAKVWSELTSACSGQPRCLLMQDYNNWGALRRSGSTWAAWNNELTGPFWVRLDHNNQWAGDVGKLTRFYYNTAQQNGHQFGNLTEVHELTHAESSLAFNSWQTRVTNNSGLTLLRKTVTDYYPNTNAAVYIVNKPARVRILKADNSCVSEVRSVYDNVDTHYQTAPTNGMLKKQEQALSACSTVQTIDTYDTAWAITRYAHDAYGNVLTVNRVGAATNGSQNDITMFVYDPTYQLFPIEQYKTNLPSGLTEYKERGAYYGVNVDLSQGSGDSKFFWGAMAEHCGVNGVCTRQSYDAFGRPMHRWERESQGAPWWDNDAEDADAAVRWSYSPPSGSQTALIVTEWRAPRCYGNFVRRHYNGLGQLIIEQRPDQSWRTSVDGCGGSAQGQEIDLYYDYDALGRQTRISAPKLVSRSGYATRTGDWSVGYTATNYDRLGRPIQVASPSGENSYFGYAGRASHHYGRDRTKATNQSQAYKTLRWQELDEWGYLRYVRTYEYNGSSWGSAYAQVSLSHDILGNLLSVTHPASIGATTMTYDLGGRKTAMSDPDLGNWSYAYDRQGKLTRQTDARSKSICLYYDKLERLVGKHFRTNISCPASPSSYDWVYDYDGYPTNNLPSRGQLSYLYHLLDLTTASYEKELAYDSKGRLAAEKVRINGLSGTYQTNYIYDDYNRLSVMQYPDNTYVRQTYNSMGLPNVLCEATLSGGVYSCTGGVRMVDGPTTGGGIPNGVAYDHAGRVTQMRFPQGGNLWRTYRYTPFNQQNSDGGMLDAIYLGTTTSLPPTTPATTDYSQLRLEYDYDSFANVKTLREGHNGAAPGTFNFSYDAHNRLTNAFNYAYAYDTAGRITSYEGAALGYDSVKKHAVNTVGGTDRYDYDANGNVTVRHKGLSTQQTLTWSHENRLASLTATGLSESYLYDDAGIRVKKVSGSTTTYYPFPHYEVSGSTVTKYYFFAGQRVAMKVNGTLYYLHGDHLSSTAYASTSSGSQQSGQAYYAYGRTRFVTGAPPSDHKFTGQKLDASTGLYYYNARYYDPVIGHFISPDTLVPDPTSVWDYNRFLYVRGNPLKFTDPSGYYSNDEIMDHFGCNEWACVEAYFQDGGAYGGLWGWLYVLQQAVDGDRITSTMIGRSGNHSIIGAFSRAQDGTILVIAQGYIDPRGVSSLSGITSEGGFATFAAAGAHGSYELRGANQHLIAARDYRHNYVSIAPGILLLTAAKAGTSLGPAMAQAGAASCVTGVACPVGATVAAVGQAYAVVGWGVTIADDYVLPLLNGDWQTVGFNAGVEITAQVVDQAGPMGKRVAPVIGPAVDIVQGLCYGTGCRR